MTDDRDQFERALTERLRAHEDRAPGGVAPKPGPSADRRRWTPVALLGAAGIVAGALLVALLLQRSTPPTGVPTPSAATPGPSTSDGTSYRATPMEGLSANDRVVDIALIDGHSVAVGDRFSGLGIWTKDANGSWSPVSDLAGMSSDDAWGVNLSDLEAGAGGAVAVGYWSAPGKNTPRIALSGDGAIWSSALGPDDPAQGDCGEAFAVTGTGGGWVTVGDLCNPDSASAQRHAEAWVSADGATWRAVPIDESHFGTLVDVVAGDGRLVAVGGRGDGGMSAASTDGGLTWTTSRVGTATFDAVAYHAGLFVAAGSISDRATIWVSPDGLAWEQVYQEATGDLITRLVTSGDQLTAVGGRYPSASRYPFGPALASGSVMVWVSTDGRSWSEPVAVYSDAPTILVTGAVAGPSGLTIAIGRGQDDDPTVPVPFLLEGPTPSP